MMSDQHNNQRYLDLADNLNDLGRVVESQASLEACLDELAGRVALALQALRSSIMLLKHSDEDQSFKLKLYAHYGEMPPEAYFKTMALDEGIAGQVARTGEPVVVEDINKSPYRDLSQPSFSGIGGGFISAPLKINNEVIGVLNISEPFNQTNFSHADLPMVNLVTLFVSKSIQVYQLQSLIQSNFAQLAIANQQEKGLEMLKTSTDSQRMARLLTHSFYQEMKKIGLDKGLIIGSATELISLVSRDMRKASHKE